MCRHAAVPYGATAPPVQQANWHNTLAVRSLWINRAPRQIDETTAAALLLSKSLCDGNYTVSCCLLPGSEMEWFQAVNDREK